MEIREYRAGDDEACRRLEARASGQTPPWIARLVDAAFINFAAFDARVAQFEEGGMALVAEAHGPDSAEIVGTICGAVKRLWFGGQEVKVCYVFDLRVAPEARRSGLGHRLSQEVERLARERFGVERLYLTVNSDNHRARGLYEKCGFSVASRRAPATRLLLGQRPALPRLEGAARCELLRGAEATRALAAGCGRMEGAPCDFAGLTASANFLGVVRCSDGESEAGIGLWDSSALSGFAITRLVLPARWYFGLGGHVAGGCLCASALALLVGALCRAWLLGPWHLGAASALSALCGYGLARARPFVRVLALLLEQSSREEPVARMRGRAFGAWRRGGRGPELLLAALRAGDTHLAEAGFAFRVCNLDQDHPLRDEVFERPSFRTLFLQKDLVATGAREPPLWAPENFHDPRDI